MIGEKTTSLLTNPQEIRLHSLQLAYRHDRATKDILERAEELAKYVEGPQAAVSVASSAKPSKRSGAANGEQVAPEGDLI